MCVVRCNYEAMRNAKMYRDQDCVIQFLMNLNENFSVVKSQILLIVLPAKNHERRR